MAKLLRLAFAGFLVRHYSNAKLTAPFAAAIRGDQTSHGIRDAGPIDFSLKPLAILNSPYQKFLGANVEAARYPLLFRLDSSLANVQQAGNTLIDFTNGHQQANQSLAVC